MFLTGSRAYGEPKPDSDFDLVLLIDPCDRDTLAAFWEMIDGQHDVTSDASNDYGECDEFPRCVRCGPINLILCYTQDEYDAWWNGTDELKSRTEKVTRDYAIQVFQKYRDKYGVRC